jgi:hypothetical protein
MWVPQVGAWAGICSNDLLAKRRGKAPSRVPISADGAHTEAAALLRRRNQGRAAADGAEL